MTDFNHLQVVFHPIQINKMFCTGVYGRTPRSLKAQKSFTQINMMRNTKIILPGLTLLLILISCEEEQNFEYPLVYTGEVTNITDIGALFTAKISCLGDYPILESGFIWGVHSNDNTGLKLKNEEDVNEIYSLNTNEKLLPAKTFYVRGYVQTENAISYGNEVNFESPGQIDTGKWSPVFNDNVSFSWCEFIKSSFTIDRIAYFSFEADGDLYSYDLTTNTFTFELSNSHLAYADISVVYKGYAYIFSENAFYRFDPHSKSIAKLSVLSETDLKYGVSGFLIEDNIYVGLGKTSALGGYSKDFWKYNITTDSWQQIASFPGEYRKNSFSFSIYNLGFVGGGYNLIMGQSHYPTFNDLWCYFPESNKWIQKESLPSKNIGMIGTNTEGLGYCFNQGIFYEYNPVFNNWERMADLNDIFCYPHIFTIDSKLYILGATSYMDKKYFNKMWVYEK